MPFDVTVNFTPNSLDSGIIVAPLCKCELLLFGYGCLLSSFFFVLLTLCWLHSGMQIMVLACEASLFFFLPSVVVLKMQIKSGNLRRRFLVVLCRGQQKTKKRERRKVFADVNSLPASLEREGRKRICRMFFKTLKFASNLHKNYECESNEPSPSLWSRQPDLKALLRSFNLANISFRTFHLDTPEGTFSIFSLWFLREWLLPLVWLMALLPDRLMTIKN